MKSLSLEEELYQKKQAKPVDSRNLEIPDFFHIQELLLI